MNLKKLLALVLAAVMIFSIAACTPNDNSTPAPSGDGGSTSKPTGNGGDDLKPTYTWEDDGKNYTYNTYNSVMPSNWNELTYQDENDSTLIGYFTSSFFTYDFKFDEYGEIISGDFEVKYSAASGLEDVTAQYAAEWGIDATENRIWKVTLRTDLKWENGDPIDAHDFIYTMKEQLNPLFQNYRADSYYGAGSMALVGAKAYAKQGQSGWFAADSVYDTYSEALDSGLVFSLNAPTDSVPAEIYLRTYFDFPESYDATKCAAWFIANYWGKIGITADILAKMEGKTLAEIKADAEMNAAWEAILGWWKTEPNEELNLLLANYTFPEASWDDVGIFAPSDYEIVVVLEKPLALFREDGTLSYRAAYNFSGLPLVHEATYEACKQAPAEGSTLWTTTYNKSLANTMSWGPYKLQSFQSGKQYVCVRNTEWYGYQMEENEGLYLTDKIVCDKVELWQTAWQKFLAGEIDGIGLTVDVVEDYKGSSRTYFTPNDAVASLQLQSNYAALKARQSDGVNKTLLAYTEFRKAISLSINRVKYAAEVTSASKAGYGLFGPMHYYDVENGGVFRDTDEAKKVLCDVYAVDINEYGSLDEAYEALTDYNLTEARELLESAYKQALEDGEINATDKVVLTYGSSADNENVRRVYNYLKNAIEALAVGTSLEGRLTLDFNASFGSKWADDFKSGAYDLCSGGWTGAAWDPGYFLLAYLDDNYRYAQGWDPTGVQMTYTMLGEEYTMNLIEWYNCLNGVSGAAHDWSEAAIGNKDRLGLIAALEGEILKTYYALPITYSYAASMLSYKLDYITCEYNTFMGYGGLKYAKYNYTDEEWAAALEEVNHVLDYKR